MSAPITSIGATALPTAIARPDATPARGGGFADTLLDAVSQARALEGRATDASARFADGDPAVGIHEVVIAAEEANVAVRFATTMKNKVLEAYRELMNTPV